MSFLSTIGADFKKVFAFIGNPKVQSTITTVEVAGESVADALDPALAGLNPLISSWTQEVFKAEALAAAASQQTGSGALKTAAVVSVMGPQLLAFAEQNKLSAPTAADISVINNAVVTILNTLGSPAATTPTA